MARRLEDEDDTPEEKLEATKWKEGWMVPWVLWGFPFGGFSVDWRIRQLDRGEKTNDTGGCLAISGATPILSFLSAPGRFSCLF